MTKHLVVDSHQHFWDPTRAEYPWMTDELAAIRRPIGPEDLRPILRESGVDRTVVVQTRSDLAENQEFLAIAAATDFVAGVVGWIDLTEPAVGDKLAEIQEGANGEWLVGIRHQVHDEEDPDWVARDDVVRGIGEVGKAGLAYDLLPRERELPACLKAVDAYPEMRFVVDHIAKPRMAEGVFEPWAARLKEIAKRPNVWCKLSGMVTEAMVAQVALVDPQMAENPAQAKVVAMAMPPGRWPINRKATLKRRVLMPAWKATCPMKIKRGITVRL